MTKKILFGIFALFLFASCTKEVNSGKINRDCTGTYLELDNKDYLICNPSMTDSYSDGSEVLVQFDFKSEGKSFGTCYMHHENYGFVEITYIRK
jgi:hypothetical protein